jgi:acetoin utilization deacetylase AcuC-like enzyme
MQVFHSPASHQHEPKTYFRRGKTIAHPETSERVRVLSDALGRDGFTLAEAVDHGLEPLRAVHTIEYLDFLAHAWERRAEVDPDAEELLTTHFARPQMHRRPDGLMGLLGYHTADTSTPIRAGTWRAVYGSAQSAISAADAAIAHGQAYALCRPPGHHAYADSAGGFCYVNNTAVAAQRLCSTLNASVAVLDIDVHHGNGTQGIFYERADVCTVSIHADPSNYFPFFSGYVDERGRGPGEGFNLNLPVPQGSGDEVFLDAVKHALERIRTYAPAALVIALGLDASEHDPIGALKVTTQGFGRAAEAIGALRVPTAIVQEGGYLCPSLPVNLVAFLGQFARHVTSQR